ncbi:MAG: phage tail protein [Lawsonibacter sp.]|nr:phage tail protein [Lawsonibacter sp.]
MKTVDAIYQEMLACFGEQTGMELREGCDLSARLYAMAAQVYTLYAQAAWVVRQAFPQTAEGEYLDRHAQLRGLERKQGAKAEGMVRFFAGESALDSRVVPRGTVCMTAGLVRFETVEEGMLPRGTLFVDVPVRAAAAGTAGNVSAGAIVSMAVAPVGIASCTNLEPFAGGGDQEGDEGLRARVLDTFKRLPNGANNAFYEQGALSFDQVAAAAVVPRPRGIGTVDVIVATLAGMPGQELLDQLTDYFQERREIAVEVLVRPPRPVTVDLSVQVASQAGRDRAQVLEAVETALRGWFSGERLGRDVLRAELGNLIYSCDGVANYTIAAPAADVRVDRDVLPVLGSLTVGEMA